MRIQIFVGVGLLFWLGCSSSKVSKHSYVDAETVHEKTLEADSIDTDQLIEEQEADFDRYKGEKTRHFRLIHTKLGVSFDWEKRYLNGKVTLLLEPYFYNQSQVVLDAKDMVVLTVSMISGDRLEKLSYEYDGSKLTVDLGEDHAKGQKITLQIDYIAKPDEEDNVAKDKKGLYFINPTGKEKGKPQQIWTHGETESNSRWFPTIDAPNQKSTQETFITVDNKYATLSNGALVYSKTNEDGTRTDYWKMDKPHAPYLFMLAVGEFAKVEDNWKDLEVDYYVETEYEEYADDIFGRTPEMMEYFSKLLKYPYPWAKYSQIVVRDFVSGAMENTTASVFMEDLNVDDRELIDYNWDDIIAHELFHQWFGNLVTCESWANLALNESFATYGEYLWKVKNDGLDEANYHLYEELGTYLNEAQTKKEDLIRFYYTEDDELFDSHSYAKGGLILHLLRNYLGDEAFFKSLEYYLKSHAFGKAEVHDLRMAFEHISGEDLNWYFNQWFLAAGHPKLRIEEAFDEEEKFIVKVWQDQDLGQYPLFKLPLILDVWEKGENNQYLVEIDQPYQEIEFDDISKPELVIVDSDFVLVGEITHIKTPEQYLFQYRNYTEKVRARIDALEYFLDEPGNSISKVAISEALDDSFWVIREQALQAIETDSTDYFVRNEARIKEIALSDPHPLVKAGAIAVLASKDKPGYTALFKSNLYDSSYSVAGQALYAYLQTGAEDIDNVIQDFSSVTNFNIASSIADYYIQKNDHTQYSWFSDKLNKYQGADLWYFIKLFGMYLLTAPNDQAQEGIMELAYIAKNHNQAFNRLSAIQSLELLSDVAGVAEILDQIKVTETDSTIKKYFE